MEIRINSDIDKRKSIYPIAIIFTNAMNHACSQNCVELIIISQKLETLFFHWAAKVVPLKATSSQNSDH